VPRKRGDEGNRHLTHVPWRASVLDSASITQPGSSMVGEYGRQGIPVKHELKVLCWCQYTTVLVPQPDVMARLTLPCKLDRCQSMDAEARGLPWVYRAQWEPRR
jgi:hypothetical protein